MADASYQSVQYVVTNIPEGVSDSAVKRNIQRCYNVQVCEFVRLPDSSAGLITFENQQGEAALTLLNSIIYILVLQMLRKLSK